MIKIITIINIILLLLLYLKNTLRILYYYQNDNYHYRIYRQFITYDMKSNVLPYLLIIFLFFKHTLVLSLLLLIITLVSIFYNHKNHKNPKITNRLKRYLLIQFLLLQTIILISIKQISLIKLLIVLNIIYILISFITSYLSSQLEKIINYKYLKKAKQKVIKYKPLIIGITGSCGKTSVKNYIYEALKKDYIIYKSPKSYNTLKGLTITINKYLNNYRSILILEMGLSYKNDIKNITKHFKPNISIITEILPSHLQTMKTMDNIIKEKMYVIKNMQPNGLIIINNDNKLIKDNINKYNIYGNKIIKIGVNNDNDYYAKNIIIKKDGLEFDIMNNENNTSFHISNNTVGRHNIYNILICYAILNNFNKKYNNLNELENYENRLEIKKHNKMIILNDSYNSNIKGFLSALEILSLYENKKVLITPGIVEGGEKAKEQIFLVSKKIIEICDFCYIIDNKNTPIFREYFEENNYKNYEIKSSFLDAFNDIKNEEITLLIENDLTDYYFIK